METFRWAGWRDEAKESGGKRDGQSLCWTLVHVGAGGMVVQLSARWTFIDRDWR